MSENLPEIRFKAIGTVHNEIKKRHRHNTEDIISEIVLDPALAGGLDDIEDFSHLIIIFYMHRSHLPFPLKVQPRFRVEPGQVGVFASRSPDRPNPLGKTIVKLLEHRENVLKVQGLDAIDGTPVIDIKPFIPDIDAVKNARTPAWMKKK
ncbi:MAG: tRNA (N6-threonylcarbamoyladenosine(37)-N6)-methyltransferase TrmO [Dehalococcoidales bacterium]|nr:tRNA (N6-threonylcarbamoyladenosine(37)-N6)-methyltransferase TrmO [Dehalococcoidales bacterium]